MKEYQILNILPGCIREHISKEALDYEHLQEIRLRVNQVPILIYGGSEWTPTQLATYKVKESDVKEMLEYVSQYSLYAYEQELKQGYITVEGGHRVGMVGKAIMEGSKVKNLQYISSLNLRVSHEMLGCAEKIIPYLVRNKKLCHTLLISPPRCGKTTLLRDVIRVVSNGNKYVIGGNVGVVDERSELGGCYRGIPQNNLGCRTDVLDACSKVEGMMMLVRSMSPEVVAVDEVGMKEDIEALEQVMRCGCTVLGSIHGSSLAEIEDKPILKKLINDQIFERYIVLGKEPRVGTIRGVYDGDGHLLYQDVR